MEERNIMEDYQARSGAESTRDSRKFAEIMAYSTKEAAQYCVDCGIDTEINGINVKDIVGAQKQEENVEFTAKPTTIEEINELESIQNEETTENVFTPEDTTDTAAEFISDEATQPTEVIELTKEDVKELLKANNIEFKGTLGFEKLVEIAKNNKLL